MKLRKIPKGYQEVVFADDLPDCKYCGDKWCPLHDQHYADCSCLGPTEEASYKIINGKLYGKRLDKTQDRE